jgi:hypothetical protein
MPLALRATFVLPLACSPFAKERPMPKTIEHVHWPDAPDLWMPYAPAIKVRGGTTVYLAGVTAAPVYHHHPHRPEEFDAMPSDMAGQARAALDNLQRGLKAVGASFAESSPPIALSLISAIRTRSIVSGRNISVGPSQRRRRCRSCGWRPIRVVSSRSTRLP